MDPSKLTDLDHAMIHHAKRRGRVVLATREVEATLIAWKPTRHRAHCRVEFDTGRQVTLRTTEIIAAIGLEQ